MATVTDRLRRVRCVAVLLAVPLAAIAPVAHSAEIVPYIELSQIYTDNVALAPRAPEKQAEFVTRIAPGIDIDLASRLFEASLGYTFEALIFARESDRNESFHQATGNAALQVWPERLSLLGTVDYGQQNDSPLEPLTRSNWNVTGNRSNYLSYQVGPEWREGLGPVNFVGRYQYGGIDYDGINSPDEFDDVNIQTVTASLSRRTADGVERGQDFDWRIDYSGETIEYETTRDAEYQQLLAEISLPIGANWEIFANGGMESDYDTPFDGSLEDGVYELGIATRTDNMEFLLAGGSRSYGSTFRSSFVRRFTNASFTLGYAETPGNSDRARLERRPRSALADRNPVLDGPGQGFRLLRKRTDVSVSVEQSRTTLTLAAYVDRETDKIDNTGQPEGDDEIIGFDARIERQLGTKTGLFGEMRFGTYSFDDEPAQDYDFYEYNLGVDRQLGQKTNVSLTLSHNRRSADTASADEYREIQAILELYRRLP